MSVFLLSFQSYYKWVRKHNQSSAMGFNKIKQGFPYYDYLDSMDPSNVYTSLKTKQTTTTCTKGEIIRNISILKIVAYVILHFISHDYHLQVHHLNHRLNCSHQNRFRRHHIRRSIKCKCCVIHKLQL